MPPRKQSAGNSIELDRLEKKIIELESLKDRILEDKKKKEEYANQLLAENCSLKKSLEAASEKIKTLEIGQEMVIDGKATGWVDVACMVGKNGMLPLPTKVDGVIIPRKIEDGVVYETMPKERATPIMAEKFAFTRVLLGPVDKINGEIRVGKYLKPFTFYRHKVRKDSQGNVEFIRVEIEEPKA